MRVAWLLALFVGCGVSTDAPMDAPPARVLRCEVPRSITMLASDEPPNPGVPIAVIGWSDDECTLRNEVGDDNDLLAVADLTGVFSGSLSIVAVEDWRIVSSSLGSGPTTMIVGVPRDTDVELLLGRDGVRVSIVLRVEGDVVVVVAMTLA
ncbi:MAG: hypothetical protein MUE69_06090 [Myxococcota bacterium]|nr:hypothetical protein [Myxococcota bacterium]